MEHNATTIWLGCGALGGLAFAWFWAWTVSLFSNEETTAPPPTPPLGMVPLRPELLPPLHTIVLRPLQGVSDVPIPDALQQSANDLQTAFDTATVSAQKAIEAEATAVAARSTAEQAKSDAQTVASTFTQKLAAHQALQQHTYTLPAIPPKQA